MQKLFTYFVICLSFLFGWNSPVVAQSELDLEDAVESLEELANELGNQVESGAEEIGEAIEDMIEEHAEVLEEWAEKYSNQWEDWASRFELRFDRWAKSQERVWEDWADEYSERWETWAEDMEEGEWDSERVGEMIQRNLEMLGEMPLGQMVEGLLKEGSEGFESAPWESLGDLQSMLQESIEKSVEETERRMAAATKNRSKRDKDVEDETGYILPLIENQQEGIKTKEKFLAKHAKEQMSLLKKRLESGDLDDEEMETISKQMLELSKQRKVLKLLADDQRQLKREKELQQQEKNRLTRAEQAKLFREQAAERKRIEMLEKAKRGNRATGGDALLKKMYRTLELEERKIQEKNTELEQLRKEIEKLREQVEAMQKERRGDDNDDTEASAFLELA